MNKETSKHFWENPHSNMFIYGLIDPRDGSLKYIGKTTQGIERFRQHYYSYKSYSKEGKTKKVNWINKLKKLNLIFDIVYLEYFTNEKEMNESETFYIQYFRSIGCNLLNHNDGGEDTPKHKVTDDTKKILSEKSRLAWKNPEIRQKMIKNRTGIPSNKKGKPVSEEIRRKNLQSNRKAFGIKLVDSNNKIYLSIKHAAKELKCSVNTIKDRLNNNPNKPLKGLIIRKL